MRAIPTWLKWVLAIVLPVEFFGLAWTMQITWGIFPPGREGGNAAMITSLPITLWTGIGIAYLAARFLRFRAARADRRQARDRSDRVHVRIEQTPECADGVRIREQPRQAVEVAP